MSKINKEFVKIKLSDLIPYENNPRLNDEAVADVVESIRQCENLDPIEIDENNVILSGHTRLKALKQIGYEETECLRYHGLTEDQKRKYRLLAIKTGEKAKWDVEKLAQELDGLDFCGFDFDFSKDVTFSETGEVCEDDYLVEIKGEAKTKKGEIYSLGRHRLMCGDSTVADDVEKLCAGCQVDMLLTDPPYNVDYTGGTKDKMKIANDSMDNNDFRKFLLSAFKNAKSALKKGGAFYIWHADTEGYNFRGACIDAGLMIRQCLIWVKNSLVLGRQDFQWRHEPCLYGENPPPYPDEEEYENEYNEVALYGWKEGAGHYWFKNRKQTTILEFDRPKQSREHPTMKPVKLFNHLMRCSSKPGEVVLDLFAGSGTAIMAAEQNGRVAYCMEYDPHFCDVIIDRWEKFTGEKAVVVSDG